MKIEKVSAARFVEIAAQCTPDERMLSMLYGVGVFHGGVTYIVDPDTTREECNDAIAVVDGWGKDAPDA